MSQVWFHYAPERSQLHHSCLFWQTGPRHPATPRGPVAELTTKTNAGPRADAQSHKQAKSAARRAWNVIVVAASGARSTRQKPFTIGGLGGTMHTSSPRNSSTGHLPRRGPVFATVTRMYTLQSAPCSVSAVSLGLVGAAWELGKESALVATLRLEKEKWV